MSKAPLDGTDRAGRSKGETGREGPRRSFLGGVAVRVTTVCRMVGGALRDRLATLLGSSDGSTDRVPTPSRRLADDRSTKPAQYALVSDGTDGDPSSDPASDPGGDTPDNPGSDATSDPGTNASGSGVSGSDRIDMAVDSDDAGETSVVPADGDLSDADRNGPDYDRPDLDARWHGDELTLVSPDEPDARITSDVWEDVER